MYHFRCSDACQPEQEKEREAWEPDTFPVDAKLG